MSLFLGPIHQWMYEKIQVQEDFTARLLELSQEEGLARELAQRLGVADTAPLEQIIDPGNIHGWLNDRVLRAEERFAACVEALLQQGVKEDAMVAVAGQLGRARALPPKIDVAQAYQAMDQILLDGMPCDGGRRVLSQEADSLSFVYDEELHPLCSRSQTGRELFAALRQALLQAMIEGSALRITALGQGMYQLTKEDVS